MSPDARFIISSSWDKSVKIFDLEREEQIEQLRDSLKRIVIF